MVTEPDLRIIVLMLINLLFLFGGVVPKNYIIGIFSLMITFKAFGL